MLLVAVVAALHAALVALLLTGGLLALRWPRVVPWHAAAALGIGVVHVLGADCPLTTWERALRERAGAAYDGGFLDHYVFLPLGVADHPALPAVVYALVLVPNLVGYGLLLAQRAERRVRAQPQKMPVSSRSTAARSGTTVFDGPVSS